MPSLGGPYWVDVSFTLALSMRHDAKQRSGRQDRQASGR